METLKTFMENSSICGLAHISNSKTNLERIFWVVVSILMIAGTGYLTAEALNYWAENPISTVVETFPIFEVKFPKIVVCPPKVDISFRF